MSELPLVPNGHPSTPTHFKSLFPAFYALVFGITLLDQLFNLIQLEPSPLVNAAVGSANQVAIWTGMQALVVAISIYLFVNYITLELFEHRTRPAAIKRQAFYVGEFLIRAAILTVVSIKILKAHSISDVFLLISTLTFLQLLWTTLVRVGLRYDFPSGSIFLHSLIFIVSLVLRPFFVSASLQINFGVWIFGGSIIITIAVLYQISLQVRAIGLEAAQGAITYCRKW